VLTSNSRHDVELHDHPLPAVGSRHEVSEDIADIQSQP